MRPAEIHQHRERMLAKHSKTVFILAHTGMMGFDLKKAAALLDTYPNINMDVSAAIQEVGRQPRTARKFFLQYQDRIILGTDGGLARTNDLNGFWRPHFRLERRCTGVGKSIESDFRMRLSERSITKTRCDIFRWRGQGCNDHSRRIFKFLNQTAAP